MFERASEDAMHPPQHCCDRAREENRGGMCEEANEPCDGAEDAGNEGGERPESERAGEGVYLRDGLVPVFRGLNSGEVVCLRTDGGGSKRVSRT